MKIEQLKVLDAVVKAGSFARAANEILFISQPAVSTAIKKLEKHLGLQLFSRETYRPTLTTQGEIFYEKAKVLLDNTEALEVLGYKLATGIEPQLKIAFDAGYLMEPFIEVLRKQTQTHTQTQFILTNEILGGSIVKLMDDQADIALGPLLPGLEGLLPLKYYKLATLKLSTLVAPDFPPYKRGTTIYPEDLIGYTQIVSRSNDRYLPKGGFGIFPQCLHCYVNDNSTKMQLIAGGVGFGMLNHCFVKEKLEKGNIVPFENLSTYQELTTTLCIFQRSDRQAGPVQQDFWQAITKIPFVAL